MKPRLPLLFCLLAAPSLAAALPAWQPASSDIDVASLLRHPAATAAQRIRIDAAALQQADELELALPGGRHHTLTVVARERREGGDLWLLGRIGGESTAQVSLTLSGGYLGGLISAPEGNYEVTTLADGSQVVIALNQEAFPECATGAAETVPALVPGWLESGATPMADTANRTDVMLVFSPEALTAIGGLPQAQAFAQSAVDSSNTAFRNSDMTTRFRLAGIRATTRAETGNSSTDLTWLQSNAEVIGWRNELGADLVSLITQSLDACGRGYLQSSPGAGFAEFAVQVTARNCAVGNLSYVHEHGHNMGMGHDPGNGNGAYAYSLGHFVNGSFRTVMAYDTNCVGGCTRRAYFSNPAVSYSGNPTGVVDQRDNHRTGNQTADIVANFRTSGIIFLDGFQPSP